MTIVSKVIVVCNTNKVLKFIATRLCVIILGLLIIGKGLIDPTKMLDQLEKSLDN